MIDGWWRGRSFAYIWRDSNGNRNVPYAWDNSGKRKLNLNYFENDWNDNYRFLAVRNSLFHQISLPTAKHSADFGECLAEDGVFISSDNSDFPAHLQ